MIDIKQAAEKPCTYKAHKRFQAMMKRPYGINIRALVEEEGGGYIAYLPDFGVTCCSAPGDTIAEALEFLEEVKVELFTIYIEDGKEFPPVTYLKPLGGNR